MNRAPKYFPTKRHLIGYVAAVAIVVVCCIAGKTDLAAGFSSGFGLCWLIIINA